MFKETALGQIRHYLTIGGGYLIGQGLATQGDIDTIVGAVLAVVGAIWSIVDKYLSQKITPPPVSQ